MGFLHLLYIAVCGMAMFALAVGVFVMSTRAIHAWCARQTDRLRAQAAATRATGAAVALSIVLFLGAMYPIAVHGPSPPQLTRGLAKFFTYESTRVRIELAPLSAQHQQQWVDFLPTLMAGTSRTFRYTTHSRYAGTIRQAAILPSYYRIQDGVLEIHTGQDLAAHENIPPYQRMLAPAGDGILTPPRDTLPTALSRTIRQVSVQRGQHFSPWYGSGWAPIEPQPERR